MGHVMVLGFHDVAKYAGKVEHVINTTSRSTTWSQALSPFFVGPVPLYGRYVAHNVENAWQYSKVYPEHADGKDHNPTSGYFEWAVKGWTDTVARRYPMGRGRKPLYSLWDGEKLSYLEARKRIYAPLYAQAVLRSRAFDRLLAIHESGESYALVDFDGYDYLSLGMSLKDVLNDDSRKMGHAFVLAMLLESPALRDRYRATNAQAD